MIRETLQRLAEGRELLAEELAIFVDEVVRGRVRDIQVVALLTGLAARGITTDETAALAQALSTHRIPIAPRVHGDLLDTCGTGGGRSTFNISTACAIVCAAAEIPVAKHGSRALTSRAGSADVLEALGFRIDLPATAIERMIESAHFGFIHAPDFNPAMRRLLAIESALGIKTLFYSLIGPLINPAGASRRILGVYRPDWLETASDILRRNPAAHALVVHGLDPVDEISASGPTRVLQLESGGAIHRREITPEQFGLARGGIEDLRSLGAQGNADLIRSIFSGARQGTPRDAVLLNSAGALIAAGRADDFPSGIALAAELIDRGTVARKLDELVRASQSLARSPALSGVPADPPRPSVPEPGPDEPGPAVHGPESPLARSEQDKRARLQTLIETLPDLIWLNDPEGRLLNCNARFERLTGASEAELKGRAPEDRLPPELRRRFEEGTRRVLESRKPLT